jgi:hypothetical protein
MKMKIRDHDELERIAIEQGWADESVMSFFIFGYEIVALHDGIVLAPKPSWERLAQDAFIKGAELAETDFDDFILAKATEETNRKFGVSS